MTGIGEITLAQPVKPPLRERRACLAKLVKNRLTLTDADDAAISMQVSRARRKLSEAGADPIATVWGMGYKWQL